MMQDTAKLDIKEPPQLLAPGNFDFMHCCPKWVVAQENGVAKYRSAKEKLQTNENRRVFPTMRQDTAKLNIKEPT